MPKVSVILTSFNHEKYIREAIDSVLDQTFVDFELIIWDDASSDSSWAVINSYTDSRIKAFRNEVSKRGIYGINKAISEVATGEYIAIHHSDDVWELDKLEKQIAFLDAHADIGAVFTNALAIGEDSSPLADENHFYAKIFDQPNRTRHEWLRHFFTRGNALCHPSVMIRKSCYEDCGLYRFGLAQVGDFDMWIRLCMKHEIYVLPERLIRFRVLNNEGNASGNRPETRVRGDYEYYKLMLNYRKIKKFDDLVKVFPGAKKYFRKKETDTEFVLAMVALEEKPFIFTELFGQDLLFEAIIDPKRSANIKRLYDFDYKSFIAVTAQHDVFSREVKDHLWRTLTERDGQIAALNQAITEEDNQITQLNQSVAGLNDQIAKLDQKTLQAEYDLKLQEQVQANGLKQNTLQFEQEKTQLLSAHLDKERTLQKEQVESERTYHEQLSAMQAELRKAEQEWAEKSALQAGLVAEEKTGLHQEIAKLQQQMIAMQAELRNADQEWAEKSALQAGLVAEEKTGLQQEIAKLEQQIQNSNREKILLEFLQYDKERALSREHAERERALHERLFAMQVELRKAEQDWMQKYAFQDNLAAQEKSNLNTQNAHLQLQVQELNREKAQLSTAHAEHEQVLARDNAERERSLHERLLATQNELNHIGNEWAAHKSSLTWRFTAPLRKLGQWCLPVKPCKAASALQYQKFDSANTNSVDTLATIDHQDRTDMNLEEVSMTINTMAPVNYPNASSASLEDLLDYHDEAFVNAAYRTLLQRSPDTEGMAYYASRLRRGASRLQVLEQICRSSEAQQLAVKLPGLEDALRRNRWLKLPIIGTILRNQSADQKLHSIENQLFRLNGTNGRRFDQIENAIASRQQTFEQKVQTAASLEDLLDYHDEAFVYVAYRTLLRRSPDAEGMAYYARRLRRGFGRLEVLEQICRSKEAQQLAVKLPGLEDALRRNKWLKLPIIGAILRKQTANQKLRSIENQLFLLKESNVRRLDQIEQAIAQRVQTAAGAAVIPQLANTSVDSWQTVKNLIFFEGRNFLKNLGQTFDAHEADHNYQAKPSTEQDDTKFRILLVSYYCPTRAHAGGLRILDIYALIRRQCPDVQLDLLTFSRPSVDWSLDDANRLFHNVYLSPTEELTPDVLLALRGSPLRYDVIDLQFHQCGYHIDAFRSIGSKILFTPMESMAKVAYINLQNDDLVAANNSRLPEIAATLRMAAEEVMLALKADVTVCVSRPDAALLRALTSSRRMRWVDTGVSQFEFAEALAPNFVCTAAGKRRCNILYMAYFGSPTNVEALRWYLDNVHPVVKARVPGYVLTVVGRGGLSAFSGYQQDDSIELVGEVDALAPYIQKARVGIAPAISGSGFRGKVNQYAILGVPSVISPIAHRGLAYQDGKNIFIAENTEAFANRCIQLLTDLKLNDRMGQAAREQCLAKYSWQAKWPTIREIYNLEKKSLRMALPKVTALVPSYNHGRYIQQRIESILNQTYPNIELIVIDDRSNDESHEVISKLQAQHGFQYLRNEKNSGTPFAAWERICTLASGDYIWVCESDDFAEPDFLETAVNALEANKNAVLFYCNSWVVDSSGQRVDHTGSYFPTHWPGNRWDADFSADGMQELVKFQLRAQTVPNMSSALFSTKAFRAAYTPFLRKLKLAGDWLFIGKVLQHGDVVFSKLALNNFRRHEQTARVRVKPAAEWAEYFITVYLLFREANLPIREFPRVMVPFGHHFRSVPAKQIGDSLRALFAISWTDTFRGILLLTSSMLINPKDLKIFLLYAREKWIS
jgi:glycosyltransferase involved in cell wall biosynthesis